ncbi:MAG: cob(I)yrinic acid a,c-diamide adenosyltransferase [Bacteroidota bacterium]
MKIYTKTGDLGSTSLLYGKRVSKADLRIESYGTVDELNANIGLLRDNELNEGIRSFLKAIQDDLFVIGSNLASEKESESLPKIAQSDILKLELEMDIMTGQLPELKHFIIPGGHKNVSICHICRTVCRRAERSVVSLAIDEMVDKNIIVYLNRLSDYFFVLARMIGKELKIEEIKWEAKK